MLNTLKCVYIFRRYRIQYTRGTIVGRTWYPRVDSKKIHVVLLKDTLGLGYKGQIVETTRGHANYYLIPEGIAVYANWQNIDLYADPKLNSIRDINDGKIGFNTTTSRLSKHSDIFIGNTLKLNFTVPTLIHSTQVLCSPMPLSKILDVFAKQHHIDILPSQVIKVNIQGGEQLEFDNDEKNFYNIGNYEIFTKFPLCKNAENILTFELEIKAVDLNENINDDSNVESIKFQLPQ
ncbi:hypothetical protein BEWA_019790 [Theileria equi strain WA]|uniref:Ribosomal protein L9 domain-containing protein n=1 Tax=Theileria equi strain WA TaxID=1537102 RepID=L0AV56_THEEQ|nr:hypothetical protein BEWA_019790 [Theileria equi strain WA]AFZ79133.1 hypothetical protein BEWA_019790 [Theileria equi strain WA]|eukprot:XP_004828799.1 hypothetical protein BEWA_019790 [Theileria equi strain WA]